MQMMLITKPTISSIKEKPQQLDPVWRAIRGLLVRRVIYVLTRDLRDGYIVVGAKVIWGLPVDRDGH